MSNDLIPNRANAQTVLRSPFDIKVHKLTFINYLEVVISPDGVVEYAVPSHVEKLLQIYMQQKGLTDREEAISELEMPCFNLGYMECLSKKTGYISVWNHCYATGCKPTQKQLNTLKTLKLNGLYLGRTNDIFTPRQELLKRFGGECNGI